MVKFLKQIVGAVLLLCGSFLFFAFTVNLTAPIHIAGPMNLWPPPVWVYLILDTFFVLLALAGMKMIGLKRMVAGSVPIVVGVLALIFIITNHVNAPPWDSFSDGNHIPAKFASYIAAYLIAGSALLMGVWWVLGPGDES